jgi:hypothetical protein
MNFTDWLAEQAASRSDEVADFAQGVACHALWPTQGRVLETFEDFVVREFGTGAVKALHRAWNEYAKSKAPKPQSNPFGGSIDASAAKARRKKSASKPPTEVQSSGVQHTNFWAGHPTLDKAALPLKPPGR